MRFLGQLRTLIWKDLLVEARGRETVLAGAVFTTHVGLDRTLGYGLKLPSDFRDTHLGRIGRG